MPTTKSAKKSLRQTKIKTLRNIKRKKTFKDLMKKTVKALESGDLAKVKELMPKVQKALDKAAKTGVLKKNTANRKKSRLAAKVKRVGSKS